MIFGLESWDTFSIRNFFVQLTTCTWIGTKFASNTLNGTLFAICFVMACMVFLTQINMKIWVTPYYIKENYSYHMLLIYGMLPLQQMEKVCQKYLYVITTLLLLIFFAVIIANLNMSYDVCTQQVVELTERAGACGREQLTELKECQSKLKEVQGRFEESSTSSLKQWEDSKAIYSKQADQALKDQENCKNRLERTELEKNMSLLDGDKRELNVKFMICSDQLEKCTQETDELEAKLSHAAKKKDESVHDLRNEEIQYVKCSEQLKTCNGQLDECKRSKQEVMKDAEGLKSLIFVVVVGVALCACLCPKKHNK